MSGIEEDKAEALQCIAEELREFNKKLEKGLELLEKLADKITIEKMHAVADALTEILDSFMPGNLEDEVQKLGDTDDKDLSH